MKKYLNYLKYVLEHKKNVFIECWKEGLYLHAITHDLSKLLPSEFFGYANHDFSSKEYDLDFEYSWLYHQRRNKHHWNYWVDSKGSALPMPEKYIKQMVCDWRAMSRKFGDTAKEFYLSNKDKMLLHSKTVESLEFELGIRDSAF